MDIRETLIAMRKLLTPEGAWTRNALARGSGGEHVREIAEGVSFCLAGASLYADNCENHSDEVISYLNKRLPLPDRYLNERVPLPHRSIIAWNDAKGRTQAEVLAFLDECIAELDPLRLDYEFEWDIPAREHELEDA